MPLESAEEREARRAREWARRVVWLAPGCFVRNIPVDLAAELIGVTPKTIESAVEAGCMTGETGPDGLMFSRHDLLIFAGAPRPIVQAVPAPAPSAEPVTRKRRRQAA